MARKHQVWLTLAERELEHLDQLSEELGLRKSEVLRRATVLGLSFVKNGTVVNVGRAAVVLETVQAAVELILEREHPEDRGLVLKTAEQRFLEFHANA